MLAIAHQAVFVTAFLRLCDVWPYKILYVEPPQGRGVAGERTE
jgi:hypothetical protein